MNVIRFPQDPGDWNGYRPPVRWYDAPILVAMLIASIGIVVAVPLLAWWIL